MTPQELAELDLAVARVEGWELDGGNNICLVRHQPEFKVIRTDGYQPTRGAQEAMRLLVLYHLTLRPETTVKLAHTGKWECGDADDDQICEVGETPCIAICKAVCQLGGRK